MARIALVKPDKAKGVEDVILRGAQYGQITEKVCIDCFSALSGIYIYIYIYISVSLI